MTTMMERELARTAANVAKAIDRRDNKIREAYEVDGMSLREIAEQVDVSHMTVFAIVKRE